MRGSPGLRLSSVPSELPLFGLKRKFRFSSSTTRMASATGLKPKPKSLRKLLKKGLTNGVTLTAVALNCPAAAAGVST